MSEKNVWKVSVIEEMISIKNSFFDQDFECTKAEFSHISEMVYSGNEIRWQEINGGYIGRTEDHTKIYLIKSGAWECLYYHDIFNFKKDFLLNATSVDEAKKFAQTHLEQNK